MTPWCMLDKAVQLTRCPDAGFVAVLCNQGRVPLRQHFNFQTVKQKPRAVIHCWEAMDVDLLCVGRNTQIVQSTFSYCLNWHEEAVI